MSHDCHYISKITSGTKFGDNQSPQFWDLESVNFRRKMEHLQKYISVYVNVDIYTFINKCLRPIPLCKRKTRNLEIGKRNCVRLAKHCITAFAVFSTFSTAAGRRSEAFFDQLLMQCVSLLLMNCVMGKSLLEYCLQSAHNRSEGQKI